MKAEFPGNKNITMSEERAPMHVKRPDHLPHGKRFMSKESTEARDPKRIAEQKERIERDRRLGVRIRIGRDTYVAEQRAKVASEGKTEEEIQQEMTENIRADKGSHLRGADALTARNELVDHYMRLPKHLALGYRDRGFDLDDLVQHASLSLVRAAERFDPENFPLAFMAFAAPTVRGDLKKLVEREAPHVPLPRKLIEKHPTVLDVRRQLEQVSEGEVSSTLLATEASRVIFERENKRPPTEEELTDATRALLPDLSAVLQGRASVESYNVPVQGEEGTYEMSDKYPDNHNVEADVVTRRFFAEILQSDELTSLQKEAVILRFWGGMTQTKIAEKVGYSQMHISRNLERALGVIKQAYMGESEGK